MSPSLSEHEVLIIDLQSTGASPARGHPLELAWGFCRASEDGAVDAARSSLLALPEGAELPRQITALTGLAPADLGQAEDPSGVWAALLRDWAGRGQPPAVIHYARFEKPFLRALAGTEVLPFPVLRRGARRQSATRSRASSARTCRRGPGSTASKAGTGRSFTSARPAR